MSVLQVSAGSSELVRAAATLVLFLHIGAGSIGLLSGAAALIFRKGSRLHRMAGQLFVGSMLTMSAIGAGVAPFLPVPERATVVAGVVTFYLVLTAWTAVRRKAGTVGPFDIGALFVSLGITAASLTLIWMASYSPTGTLDGQPRQAFYLFVIIGAIAAVGDVRLILRRGIAGGERIARHLWRMCAALFIAAGSLFLGQQQVFPASLRGSPWLFVPEMAVLALLLFWLCRVFYNSTYKRLVLG
ncbi:MAG: hypothetical protein V4634_00300 [Pseudomonadota bacterium]